MTGKYNPIKAYQLITFILLLFSATPSFPTKTPQLSSGVILTIDGPIGPATRHYLSSGFKKAENQKAKVIIIEINTPGGIVSSMKTVLRDMLSSPIPIIVYVSPEGAKVANIGTYILYASQLAAMSPGTNIESAPPVQFEVSKGKADPPASFIQRLAETQGRNTAAAEKLVKGKESIPAKTALSDGMIEVVANDLPSLLAQANGRTAVLQGHEVQLDTENLTLEEVKPGWKTRLLEMLTNPNTAYILLLIGIYGLIFEFFNPGGVAPGVLGVVCFLLGLYALSILSVNFLGLALIFVSIALIIAEAYYASFALLGIGGVVVFIIGSTLLFNINAPGFEVYWPLIFIMAAVGSVFILVVANTAFQANHIPSFIRKKTLIHKEGRVLVWSGNQGMIRIRGRNWRARSNDPIKPGDIVIVESIEGAILEVRKKERETINA